MICEKLACKTVREIYNRDLFILQKLLHTVLKILSSQKMKFSIKDFPGEILNGTFHFLDSEILPSGKG